MSGDNLYSAGTPSWRERDIFAFTLIFISFLMPNEVAPLSACDPVLSLQE